MAAALIAAFLLAQAASSLPGFLPRVLAVASLGLFSWLDIHASYWNWYGFPANFSLAALTDGLIGWALAGAVIAWRVGR